MKLWIFGIGIVFMMACATELPENLVTKDQMAAILVELHIADAITDSQIREFQMKKLLKDDFFDEILKKNELSREAFLTSYAYYIDKPVMMDSIYKNVIKNMDDYLRLIENEDYMQKNEESKKDTVRQNRIDSLRKVNKKVPKLTPPSKKNK